MKTIYYKQVSLLLETLGLILKEDSQFALKGGTAINLFYQNMPRLSVDIDLAYIKICSRESFFDEVKKFSKETQQMLQKAGLNTKIHYFDDCIPRMIAVFSDESIIKIDINLVIRGSAYTIEQRRLCEAASKEFSIDLTIPTLSFEDVYAGKICAALDRQHPRDLFDVEVLLNKPFSTKLKNAFIFYLLSHNRPIYELLQPSYLNQEKLYNSEFFGMTEEKTSYPQLEENRRQLVKQVQDSLTETDKKFLLSFKKGNPMWELCSITNLQNYPAIKWKLQNIKSMQPRKREEYFEKLNTLLSF